MKYLYILILSFLVGCAQQTALTGGEKDINAPILMVDSTKEIRNFDQSSILLKFNENVQFIDGNKGFITNPEIKNVEAIQDKRNLEIKWKDSLTSNTTYSFLFLNSIADITESNKISSFNYIISTGDYLDSGSISGQVFKYPEKNILENSLVKLVSVSNSDFCYKTYSNKNGEFKIDNIKNGEYLMYSFIDENDNLLLDTTTEVHGFLLDTIFIKDSSGFKNIINYEALKSASLDKVKFNDLGHLELDFNTPIDSCTVIDITTNKTYFSNRIINKHHFYFSDTLKKHTVIISSPNKFYDTLRVAVDLKTAVNSKLSYKKYEEKTLESKFGYTLDFNQFIKGFDSSLIKIMADSININSSFKYSENYLTILPMEEHKNYKMTLFPGSIDGLKKSKEDTSTVNFSLIQDDDLSSLELNVFNLPFKNSILQILKNEEVVKQFNINGEKLDTTILRCYPGDYKIKIVADLDGNGYWSKGDLVNRILPEPIFIYQEVIKLKKNWTLNIQWDFTKED